MTENEDVMADTLIEILMEILNSHAPEKRINFFRYSVKGVSNETLEFKEWRNKLIRNTSEEENKKLGKEYNIRVGKEKFEEAGQMNEGDPNIICNFVNRASKGHKDTHIKRNEGDSS